MESSQIWSRRRRDRSRSLRKEPPNNRIPLRDQAEMLLRWRQMLARIESEAASYRCREVEMLVGTAILALDEAIVGPGGDRRD
jgi:hypothetical protein